MNFAAPSLSALGRVLLAYLFVQGGIGKLGNIAGTVQTMASHGIPYPDILVWGAVVLELGGGILLILGLLTRLVAALYFLYLIALMLIFHPYWTMAGEVARMNRALFYNHLAIMGGMLVVVAFGAGRYSIDALICRRRPAAPPPPHPQPAE
jgi:putative oxidoreductase